VTATAIAPSVTSADSSSWGRIARVALVTLAVIVLLAVAFVLGRATGTSAHAVTTVIHTPAVTPTTTFCRLGRPC
jgi:hypothetical protein